MPAHFDDIEIGQVVSLGAGRCRPAALEAFVEAFAPGWDLIAGAPDAMVYAIWAKLDAVASTDWPQTKRLAVDALRWVRNPPAGELLRGRMTVMGKDPVGEGKGIVIAQHDLLDEAGRLVFSCLTRSVFAAGLGLLHPRSGEVAEAEGRLQRARRSAPHFGARRGQLPLCRRRISLAFAATARRGAWPSTIRRSQPNSEIRWA